MTLPIDMISDVVCPWCFIGKRRLEKALALRPNIPIEVHFRRLSHHEVWLSRALPRHRGTRFRRGSRRGIDLCAR